MSEDHMVRKTLNEIQEKLDTVTQIFEVQRKIIVNREETIKILKKQIQNQDDIIKILEGTMVCKDCAREIDNE